MHGAFTTLGMSDMDRIRGIAAIQASEARGRADQRARVEAEHRAAAEKGRADAIALWLARCTGVVGGSKQRPGSRS
jgi:hypothetical protein